MFPGSRRSPGRAPAQAGQRCHRPAGEPADRRRAEVGQVQAVRPPGGVLVGLGGQGDPGLLGGLLRPFTGGALGEPAHATPRDLLGGPLAGLLEPVFEGFAGQLAHQPLEDLLNQQPGRGDRRAGGRRGGPGREHRHHRHREQLDDQDAQLDPDFQLGALDVAAALLDKPAQVGGDREQHRERRVGAFGDPRQAASKAASTAPTPPYPLCTSMAAAAASACGPVSTEATAYHWSATSQTARSLPSGHCTPTTQSRAS